MGQVRNAAEVFAEDQRLCILRILEEAPNCRCNESILHQALPQYGHDLGRTKVTALTTWLEEAGLVEVEDLGVVRIARLTEAGEDVALGRTRHPGVKRPRLA